jgi:hypothetical protein
MPAIASLEDLKAAQKEGLNTCAMRHASFQSLTLTLTLVLNGMGFFVFCVLRLTPYALRLTVRRGTSEQLRGEAERNKFSRLRSENSY